MTGRDLNRGGQKGVTVSYSGRVRFRVYAGNFVRGERGSRRALNATEGLPLIPFQSVSWEESKGGILDSRPTVCLLPDKGDYVTTEQNKPPAIRYAYGAKLRHYQEWLMS